MNVVLVTGGAGYVGSHACKALSRAGYQPVAFDNLSTGHRWAVKWGPLVEGDIANRAALDAAIIEHRPAAVLHFAASAYVGESVRDPGKYYRNNVAGSLVLLEAMRDHQIDRLVFSSSCATYGLPQGSRMDEAHPQAPINPYGASKLMVEQMIRDFASAHGLQAIALRYFNAAGADRDGEIGECHTPETHLLPLAIASALGEHGELRVHGADYPTRDGTCIRDFVHVDDLAQAHVAALRAMGNIGFRAYNLGTGRGHSVLEVLASVERVSGRRVRYSFGPRREGDPPELVADAGRVRTDLGWSAQITDLDAIVGSAWRWHQSRMGVA